MPQEVRLPCLNFVEKVFCIAKVLLYKEGGGILLYVSYIFLQHTLLDVLLLPTTVMGHKDAQKIALGTKLFCL